MAELEKFIETDAETGEVTINGTVKKVDLAGNKYVTQNDYGVNLHNSDIYGANGIWFNDTSNSSSEGLIFPRNDSKCDTLSMLDGKLQITTGTTMGLGTSPSGGETNTMSDYVISQGTSGIWTYRKWVSGIAECWGTYVNNEVIMNVTWGDHYGGTVLSTNLAYPITFKERPREMASHHFSDTTYVAILRPNAGDNGINTSTTTGKYAVVRPTKYETPVTVYLDLYVIGKWK